MRKFLSITLAAFLIIKIGYSQDMITLKTGEDIQARVREVGYIWITYKKLDDPVGPILSVLKSDILLIRYKDGRKDIFLKDILTQSKPINDSSDVQYYLLGIKDAHTYYKGYKPAAMGAILSVMFEPVGFIVPIASSATMPNEKNLMYPDPELFRNFEYYKGYTHEAKHIKAQRVWLNFGISLVVLNGLIIYAITHQHAEY